MQYSENRIIQFFIDLKNFFAFRKQIKHEMEQAKSGMTKFGIKRNGLGNILYVQLDCTDSDLRDANFQDDVMVINKLTPIVKYLSQDLGWGEYLVPQINNFVDEEGNQTLSYGVLFIFSGYSLSMTNFLWFVLINLGLIGAGVWAILKFLI